LMHPNKSTISNLLQPKSLTKHLFLILKSLRVSSESKRDSRKPSKK